MDGELEAFIGEKSKKKIMYKAHCIIIPSFSSGNILSGKRQLNENDWQDANV